MRAAAIGLLAFISLAAFWLRCRNIGESLWIDELHTAWTVGDGLTEVAPRAWIGNQSPLYFYLLWALTGVCGLSETVLRLPSALAGAAIVPVTYWFVWRWTSSQMAAVLAAVLAAVNPLGIEFSLEARPYALVQLTALLHVLVFAELLRRVDAESVDTRTKGSGTSAPWGLRALLVAGGVLLFYLHYTAALLLPAEVAAYVAARLLVRRPFRYGWGSLLLDVALIVLCWTPAMGHLGEIAQRRENWALFIPQTAVWDSAIWFPLAYSVFWPALLLLLSALVRWLTGNSPAVRGIALPVAALSLSWEFVPALLAWSANQADLARLFFPRYLSVCLPAPAVIGGLLCGAAAGRLARAAQWLLVIPLAFYAGEVFPQVFRGEHLAVHGEEDWRGAVRFVVKHQRSDASPVLVYSNLIESARAPGDEPALRRLLLCPVTGIYRLDQPGRPLVVLSLNGRPAGVARRSSAWTQAREVWALVRGRRREADIVRDGVVAALVESGAPGGSIEVEYRGFGGVTVLRLSR